MIKTERYRVMGSWWLAACVGVVAMCMSALAVEAAERASRWDSVTELRVQYQELLDRAADARGTDPARAEELFKQAGQACGRAIERGRRVIAEYADDVEQPIWRSDLAEMLLVDELGVIHQQAADFYEFAIPTAEQAQAFGAAVVEALKLTSAADKMLARLNEGDAAARLGEDAALRARLVEEYAAGRTDFFLAHAAYYTALLPEDDAYFAEAKDEPVASQRRALLELAGRLCVYLLAQGSEDLRLAVTNLQGRVALRQGQTTAAIAYFDQVVARNKSDRTELLARLSRATALHEQGKDRLALASLAALERQTLRSANALDRLLVADLTHRILLAQAEKVAVEQRSEAVAAAYEPYVALLDRGAGGSDAGVLRHFLFRRWEATVDAQTDLQSLAPLVRLGLGELALFDGQKLVREGDGAAQEAEARQLLRRSLALSQSVLSVQMTPSLRARALFNVGAATYWLDRQSAENRLKSAEVFRQVAEEYPGEPVAEEAIGHAVALLRSLYQLNPRPVGAAKAYAATADLLFSTFSTTATADQERLYYARAVLEPAGRHHDAAEMLGAIPPGQRDYFEAQQQMLLVLEAAFEEETGQVRDVTGAQILAQSGRLAEEVQALTDDGDGERVASARRALGVCRLVQSQVARLKGDYEGAVAALEEFEAQFATETDLIRLAKERRFLALAAAGRLEAMAETARQMMEAFAHEAAPLIGEELDELNRRMDSLEEARAGGKLAEGDGELGQVARTSAVLAEWLLGWARQQQWPAEQMLSLQLIFARSLRLAGEAAQAVEQIEPVMEAEAGNAAVIHEYAMALQAVGDEASLVAAAGAYDRIIMGLKSPYPPLWWSAWTHRLEINDALGRATEDIALHVRKLRLIDPQLGGPGFRAVLEGLEGKYSAN